jgi:hypothetical protein
MNKFHHWGIPSTRQRPGETYLADARLYVTDPQKDPYGIEWLRFLPDSPMPEVLKKTSHVAFEVQDMDAALAGRQVLIAPFHPMPGVTVAFVLHEGTPVELLKVG